MFLSELLEVLNDNGVIIIYDAEQKLIGTYDGKDSLDFYFSTMDGNEISVEEFEVTDIFPDKLMNINAIGIELNVVADKDGYIEL